MGWDGGGGSADLGQEGRFETHFAERSLHHKAIPSCAAKPALTAAGAGWHSAGDPRVTTDAA